MEKGMLIVISGPSGSGKGTVVKRLKNMEGYSISVSVTTRERSDGEVHGSDYFFISREDFEAMRDNGGLLEHAEYCGNLYGTPRFYVEEEIERGNTVVLEIEVNGALQVKERFPECILIFLMPPTKSELKRRLVERARESHDEMERRFKKAAEEIDLLDEYDYLVINDRIEDALADIDTVVKAEKLRPKRSSEKVNCFKEDSRNENQF